jgi:hypothetical protein
VSKMTVRGRVWAALQGGVRALPEESEEERLIVRPMLSPEQQKQAFVQVLQWWRDVWNRHEVAKPGHILKRESNIMERLHTAIEDEGASSERCRR